MGGAHLDSLGLCNLLRGFIPRQLSDGAAIAILLQFHNRLAYVDLVGDGALNGIVSIVGSGNGLKSRDQLVSFGIYDNLWLGGIENVVTLYFLCVEANKALGYSPSIDLAGIGNV